MAPLNRLVAWQTSRETQIHGFITRFREIPRDQLTSNTVKTRIDRLSALWDTIQQTHEEIVVKDGAENDPYILDGVFARMEANYEAVVDEINRAEVVPALQPEGRRRRNSNASIDDDENYHASPAKLPKLDLPKFSGKYEDWDNFCDMFTSLVHNVPRLSNVTKLQYLKSCLHGNAADLVKDVSVTNDNYLSTWQALKNRFSNPRLIVNNHMRAFRKLPYLRSESANEFRRFCDEAQRILRALTNLGMPVGSCDFMIIYDLSDRLDPESRKLWEAKLSVKDRQVLARAAEEGVEVVTLDRFPKVSEFMEFLEERAHTLSMVSEGVTDSRRSRPMPKTVKQPQRVFHASTPLRPAPSTKPYSGCRLCSESHYLGNCPIFLKKSVYDRSSVVADLGVCFNCLGNHVLKDCGSKRRCLTCKGKHHTRLHRDNFQQPFRGRNTRSPNKKMDTTSGGVIGLNATLSRRKCSIILATAQVTLIGPRGTRTHVRALLDQGSESSFVSDSVAQLLELPRQRVQVPLSGLGACNAGIARFTTQLSLYSIHDPQFHLETEALILPRLTTHLPSRTPLDLDLQQFSGLALADPHFYEPDSVDIILGADVYGQILKPGLHRFVASKLVAQDTSLGWIVSGSVGAHVSRRAEVGTVTPSIAMHCSRDDDLQRTLQQFWEIEEIAAPTSKLSPEDESCEAQFQNYHRRQPNGRYMVRLPVNSEPPEAATETRRMALGSLAHMQRRLSKDPRLSTSYREFMQTYEELGHMERIPTAEINNSRAWYLPHHAVVQEDPWKIRVVFDASRRTRDGHRLNEFLNSGPTLQSDLDLILLNWRQFRFVFTADIVKMFRQISVHPEDREWQRILWSPQAGQTPIEYRLTTVTYGTTCAPYLAIRTLLQLAKDEETRFPLGAACLRNDTYVDDIFSGSNELSNAKSKRDELIALLRSAGIELGKWAVNHIDLSPNLSNRDDSDLDKLIDTGSSVKTLGVQWSPSSDSFGFNVREPLHSTSTPTKRSILSTVARLFDPLGWLGPVTIVAKILLQDLWLLKCDWDSVLPVEIVDRWSKYITSLSGVRNLDVTRWLGTLPGLPCELHGFSDASSRAYAAAVYLRVQINDNEAEVSLLMAKTKVSPVKTMSIPNLELTGAALLVRLLNHVRKLDAYKNLSITAWSDSQVVLAWLRKHPCYWKTFVANRVSFIQTELPIAEWRHVATEENPADLATRGSTPAELNNAEIWWHGPKWLSTPREYWPKSVEPTKALLAQPEPQEHEIFSQYSSLSRLIRVVAFLRRPLVNLRRKASGLPRHPDFLTAEELDEARIALIRLAQAESFAPEIVQLRSGKGLQKRNPLNSLKPYFDEEHQILRVGGRLTHSNLPFEAKHPPILPRHSRLSRLFVHQAHLDSLHGGPTLTASFLQQRVWVLGRSRLVKSEIRNCVVCQRAKPRLAHQLMGDLPATRVVPARPFTTTGLDYAGPFQIRTTKGRGHRAYKGYVALFVCFASRAIHLEVVSDLTTASFLAAFRRFSGRRGVPRQVVSDNGTTFQGAARELGEMFSAASTFYKEVASLLAEDGTTWSFIPPNAPHCGGLWEAGVRSTKHHLKRVIREEYSFTFEEISTLLVQIEACLNSRPLCPLTSDIDDLGALTPAHFLIGGTSALIPDEEVPDVPVNRLNRFHILQRARDEFWKRWSQEYLQHLQERSKWKHPTENFKPGQLVIVKDERYPPSKWPLGRILEVQPGSDGLVRVATIKTASSVLKRHIARLCPLSLHSERDQERVASSGADIVKGLGNDVRPLDEGGRDVRGLCALTLTHFCPCAQSALCRLATRTCA